MAEPLDRLCDQLRIKLHGMDRRLEALKANGSDLSDKSQDKIESQLDTLQQRIFDRRRTVEAANARVTAWVGDKRPSFNAKVVEWREGRQRLRLDERADDAETYALAVFDLAIAAADEAAQAALEALLARRNPTNAALHASLTPERGCDDEPTITPARAWATSSRWSRDRLGALPRGVFIRCRGSGEIASAPGGTRTPSLHRRGVEAARGRGTAPGRSQAGDLGSKDEGHQREHLHGVLTCRPHPAADMGCSLEREGTLGPYYPVQASTSSNDNDAPKPTKLAGAESSPIDRSPTHVPTETCDRQRACRS